MKKIIQNFLLIVFSIALVLSLSEVGLKVFTVKPLTQAAEVSSRVRYKSNLYYSFEHKPNQIVKDDNGKLVITINSQGFRGEKEYSKSRLFNPKKRMLILGDSCSFGTGVEDHETFSAKLENVLLSETEVINSGVRAYNAWQEMKFSQHKGYKYKPDFVIIGLVPNDLYRAAICVDGDIVAPSYSVEDSEDPGIYDLLVKKSLLVRVCLARSKLLYHSAVRKFGSLELKKKVFATKNWDHLKKTYGIQPMKDYNKQKILISPSEGAEKLLEYYKQTKKYLRADCLVVMFPEINQVKGSASEEEITRWNLYKKVFQKAGFPFIDVTEIFNKHETLAFNDLT